MTIRALVFDFDGLIIETEGPELYAWQEMYAAYGCAAPLARWVDAIGGGPDMIDPYADLEALLGHAVDREALRARRRMRFMEMILAQPILPGVVDYIAGAQARGLKLGVASNSPRHWVAGHLERVGLLGAFAALSCADDVPRVKPDPALYQAVLAALGVAPQEAIVLEDSVHGIAAAKAAGLFCVAVPNPLTRRQALDEADLRLEALSDLPLEQLLAVADGFDNSKPLWYKAPD